MNQENIKAASTDEEINEPGVIKSDVSIELHTKEALKIFMGRKEDATAGIHHIPGVSVYAKLLRVIWGACLAGNPYAKWWIMKIEERLKETETDLSSLLEDINKQHDVVAGRLNIAKSLSVKPVKVELNFATPYTYKIVYCLVKLDEITARLITLRHISLISPGEFDRKIKESRGAINRVLNEIGGFKPFDLTLNDVRENTAAYAEAVEVMGGLPEVIVKNQYTPEFFPTKNLKIAGFGKKKVANE
ncbi:PFL_4669 family integrating conjugative element protein [Thiomicrorhabdus indica]|uniref:PFL_4669 family integrating conjugative element protein n=1 Tax=Thiomicrorhabdus indica TaxID=2267253 RepID=UPI0013EE4B79|nr:TIGR03761 family integrating conjugative element protein [Thiomicrorhabdus indica]